MTTDIINGLFTLVKMLNRNTIFPNDIIRQCLTKMNILCGDTDMQSLDDNLELSLTQVIAQTHGIQQTGSTRSQ